MSQNTTTYKSAAKLIVFFVITTVLTLVLGATIANVAVSNTRNFHALFADVTGLNPGDDVRVAGVRVGQVKSVKLVNRRLADVKFGVKKNIELHTTARASVRYLNLVGQRYLALVEGGVGDVLRPGGLIPLAQTTPPLDLTALFNGFKPLFRALTPNDVNSLAYEVIQVLQGEGGTVDQLVTHTASLTNTIADRDHVVGEIVTNLNQVLDVVAQRDQGLSQLLLQLQRLVSGLSGDRDIVAESVGRIDALAASTASLLTDIRPSVKDSVAALSKVANTLATTTDPRAGGINFLDGVLQRLPSKVRDILRTASYGSWFNFFLCDFQVDEIPVHGQSNVPSCDPNRVPTVPKP